MRWHDAISIVIICVTERFIRIPLVEASCKERASQCVYNAQKSPGRYSAGVLFSYICLIFKSRCKNTTTTSQLILHVAAAASDHYAILPTPPPIFHYSLITLVRGCFFSNVWYTENSSDYAVFSNTFEKR